MLKTENWKRKQHMYVCWPRDEEQRKISLGKASKNDGGWQFEMVNLFARLANKNKTTGKAEVVSKREQVQRKEEEGKDGPEITWATNATNVPNKLLFVSG